MASSTFKRGSKTAAHKPKDKVPGVGKQVGTTESVGQGTSGGVFSTEGKFIRHLPGAAKAISEGRTPPSVSRGIEKGIIPATAEFGATEKQIAEAKGREVNLINKQLETQEPVKEIAPLVQEGEIPSTRADYVPPGRAEQFAEGAEAPPPLGSQAGMSPKDVFKAAGLGIGIAAAGIAGGELLLAPLIAVATRMGAAGRAVATTQLSGDVGGAAAGVWDPLASGALPTAAKITTNTKTAGLVSSYLTKLVAGLSNPMVALGVLGTTLYTSLFWGPNEKGDALMTLSIVQGQAAKNQDWEMVEEINTLIQETSNISASMPVIGFGKSELAKFDAALVASETYMRAAEKQKVPEYNLTKEEILAGQQPS